MSRARRIIAGTAGAAVLTTAGFTAAGALLPSDFQPRAAFNSPGDERAADHWRATVELNSASSEGLHVDVLPGAEHTIHVEGTYTFHREAGDARLADASCSIDLWDPNPDHGATWRTDRYDFYRAGLLDLQFVDGTEVRRLELAPQEHEVDPNVLVAPGCSTSHHYTATFVPTSPAVRFLVDDINTGDNVGNLRLTLTGPGWERPYQCPKRTEEAVVDVPGDTVGEIDIAHVTVDSRRNATEIPSPGEARNPDGTWQIDHWNESGHFGIYTCNWALPGSHYRITVTGTFRYAYPESYRSMADAECARGIDGGQWQRDTYGPIGAATDSLDLYVNHVDVDWQPVYSSMMWPGCDDLHTYVLESWTPQSLGPINFKIYDAAYAEHDNVGELHVLIERLGPDGEPVHSHQHP